MQCSGRCRARSPAGGSPAGARPGPVMLGAPTGNCSLCIPAETASSRPKCLCVSSSCSHLFDFKLFQRLIILDIIRDFTFGSAARINKLHWLK